MTGLGSVDAAQNVHLQHVIPTAARANLEQIDGDLLGFRVSSFSHILII